MSTDAFAFWDGHHTARLFSTDPRPNQPLGEAMTGLAPGRALDLDAAMAATWSVGRADAPRRATTGPDGRTAEVVDHVLHIWHTA